MIDDLIDRVLVREGGYVDHPSDRGGPTNMGIMHQTLAAWRGRPVTESDVRDLTKDEARAIYRVNYFTKPGLDIVPDSATQELLFDYSVNAGPAAAVKALQKAVGTIADGVIGPVTRQYVRAVTNWEAMFYRIKCIRAEHFIRILATPSQSVFANGWANRLAEFEYRRST